MTVQDVLAQIEVVEGKVKSKSTGKVYEVQDFISQICSKLKFSKRQRSELESYFTSFVKSQSEKSQYIEQIINKYNFKFSDGVYMINGRVLTIEDIYRFMWKNERLLPVETDDIVENVEHISEPMDLQREIYMDILRRAKQHTGKRSQYLYSLYSQYPNVKWRELIHNIIVPNTKPLFHIFYDDGVGGTGKSTLLEVLTLAVGQQNVSNVLLDQFSNRFMFANMLGKYLNIGDDNGKNDELQNVGTLKSIITGNRVTIDRKNINPIEVRIFAKQLFATNILPYIDFTDGGIMRRLNIVKMNKVFKPTQKMPAIDEEEISNLLWEIIASRDLTENDNSLAITNSPLYRYYHGTSTPTYSGYTSFCADNGFRCMNVINFEAKSKFIVEHMDKPKPIPESEDMPY